MKKEVLLAIFLGLIIGSILVYGIYRANQAVQPQNTDPTNDQITPTPTPSLLLTINFPSDGTILYSSIATISGQIQSNAELIILTEDDEYLVKLSPVGNFSQTIKLNKGGNTIQLTAISPAGQRQDEYLNLVYTSQ